MFLFEQNQLKILYTGDFRFEWPQFTVFIIYFNFFLIFRLRLKDVQKISALKDVSSSSAIYTDAIYIDSTFFSKSYPYFPTQFESTNKICELIDEWLAKGRDYKILLKTPARYGYEYLFLTIFKRFGQKIHVNETIFNNYQYIPELDNCFTTKGDCCNIHACYSSINKQTRNLLCCQPKYNTAMVRIIKISAMAWINLQAHDDICRKDSENFIRVCYSNHPSYNELKDFLMYLHPKKVELNVITNRNQQLLNIATIMENFNDNIDKIVVPNSLGFLNFGNIKFNDPTNDHDDQDVGVLSHLLITQRRV